MVKWRDGFAISSPQFRRDFYYVSSCFIILHYYQIYICVICDFYSEYICVGLLYIQLVIYYVHKQCLLTFWKGNDLCIITQTRILSRVFDRGALSLFHAPYIIAT